MKTINAVALSGILMLSGCSSGGGNPAPTGTVVNTGKPIIVAAIQSASELATNSGLIALAKSNPASASEAATNLVTVINTNLLPYLRGGSIGTSAIVHDLLNTSLLSNLNPIIASAIATAGAILDAYLPAPSAATYLSPDEVDYIVAFLSGVSKGCTDFQTKALKQHWIEMK